MMTYHLPVMLDEVIAGLNIRPNGVYVDVTFGGGGHSREILQHLGKDGRLYGFDQDLDAAKNVLDDNRFTFVRSNFRFLTNFLKYHNVNGVDGILADLGVSSHHFDDESRGFSFRADGKLDMRMNTAEGMTAADILNSYTEEQLADVFFYYGELKQARKIASAVVNAREQKNMETIPLFLDVVKRYVSHENEKKDLARIFQALRIEVNHEMDALKSLLSQIPDVLNENGRLVVMTYHSLEDRLVKNFIKAGNFEGKPEKDFYGRVVAPLAAVNRKVITPTDEEILNNPRSRSAKLRIAEKL